MSMDGNKALNEYAKRGIHMDMAEVCLTVGALDYLQYNNVDGRYLLSARYSLTPVAKESELTRVRCFSEMIDDVRNKLNELMASTPEFGRGSLEIANARLNMIDAAVTEMEKTCEKLETQSFDDLDIQSDNAEL